MLVVSDATPLNVLIRLGYAELLSTLYGQVVIPPAVARELSHANAPKEVREWLASAPPWLAVKAPVQVNPTLVSGAGECEAISLALEVSADFLLVDDKEARRVARGLNLRIIGTVGILELAAAKRLVELRPSLERLRSVGFFIDEEVLAQALEREAFRKMPDAPKDR